jgi:hypothetical protein
MRSRAAAPSGAEKGRAALEAPSNEQDVEGIRSYHVADGEHETLTTPPLAS